EIKPGQPLDGTENPLVSAPTTKNGRRLKDRQQKSSTSKQASPRK
ncbi:MAG TPA: site-specific DNA-methyltransferase, partial [Gimesia maris]|nr:site-specific DNA-methyltransferase [Gimesia maris]